MLIDEDRIAVGVDHQQYAGPVVDSSAAATGMMPAAFNAAAARAHR